MPAETAAILPGASGENQSNKNGADVSANAAGQEPGQQTQQQPHAEPIGDRAATLEMLNLLDVPAVIVDRVRQEAEKEAEQQQPAAGQPPKDDDTWPDSAKARVGKLTAKSHEKDAEIVRLKAQLDGTPPAGQQQPPPTPTQQPPPAKPATAAAPQGDNQNPYAAVSDETGLADGVRVARGIRDWALMNLEGADEVPLSADADGNVKTKDFTATEVRKMLVDANRALEVHLPARFEELQRGRVSEQQRQQADAARPRWEEIGLEDHPDLADPESELTKHVGTILEAYPFLKGAPDGRVVAADIVAAALKRSERLAQAGLIELPAGRKSNGAAHAAAPVVDPKLSPFLAPKPPRAPAVPSTAHGAPPPPSTDAEEKQAREDYLNSSKSDEDHTRFTERLSAIQSRVAGTGGMAPARV